MTARVSPDRVHVEEEEFAAAIDNGKGLAFQLGGEGVDGGVADDDGDARLDGVDADAGQSFVEEYEDVFEVRDLGHRGRLLGGLYPAPRSMTALTPEKARWHNLRRPNIFRRDLLKMDSVLTGYTIIDLSRDMAGSYA